MTNLRKSSHSFLLFLFLGFAGCHTPPSTAVSSPAADELLKSMHEARPDLKSLRAEARVDFNRRGRRIRFHASMLVEYPDRFFVEAGGFGFSASQVSADSKKIQVYTPAKMLAFEGAASNGLQHLFGLQMSIREWVSILLEQIPDSSGVVSGFERKGANALLKLNYDRDILLLNIAENTAWMKSMEYPLRDHLKVFFGSPMATPAGSYPSQIRIVGAGSSLDMSFEKVEPNPTLREKSFNIQIPDGMKIRPLDSSDNVIGE